MGPTDADFQQIRIIILISYINISFLYYLFFFKYDLFLLDYDRIHKKQKFSTLDIVESRSKEMWSISYALFVDIIAPVSLTP